MKKNILLLLAVTLSIAGWSQSFKIVNNSKAMVYFQIFGSDKNSCNHKYSSVTASVAPSSATTYKSPSEITWTEGVKQGSTIEYSYLSGMYTDPSGGCVSRASNFVGDQKCSMKKTAVINMAKCSGTGNLNLTWRSEGGDVTVTIK